MSPRRSPLDHSIAHRSTRAEMLVDSVTPLAEYEWIVRLTLPRSHWLCHPTPGVVPPTLLAEALRQAGMAVCTSQLGLGADGQFILSTMNLDIHDAPLELPRFGAVELDVNLRFENPTLRKNLISKFQVRYRVPNVLDALFRAQALTSNDYRVIRRDAPLMGDEVVDNEAELLLDPRYGSDLASATLGVDEADPFFFDHPVDHLPGILLLHAAVELYERWHQRPAASFSIDFHGFAELRTPVTLRATKATPEDSRAEIQAFQEDRLIASALIDSEASSHLRDSWEGNA